MSIYAYGYTKEADVDRLTVEINQSSISATLAYITLEGMNLTIAFTSELSVGDKSALDTIVANHVAVPLAETLGVDWMQCGILIPLYVYPSDVYNNTTYNNLIALKKKYPTVPVYVIVNPSSGPGSSTDGNYTVAIKRLHGANIRVLGYIDTNYTTVTLTAAKESVAKWLQLYPEIDGIFFDQMTNDDDTIHIDYYAELTEYIHNSDLNFSFGNPGLAPDYKYFTQNAADVIVVYENSSYPSESTLKGDLQNGNASFSPNTRAVIVHTQASYNRTNVEMMMQYVRCIYIQDAANFNNISPYVEQMLKTFDWTVGRKKNVENVFIKGWADFEDGFTRTSDSTFTVSGYDYSEIFVPGRPIRYKDTSGSTWYYGVVDSVSGSTVTLAGAPLQTSIDDMLQYGPMERVVVKRWYIPGTCLAGWDAAILASQAKQYENWKMGPAALVQVCHRVKTKDSGANQARVNIRVAGNPICTANSYNGMDVDTTWQKSGVDLDTGSYSVAWGTDLEVSTDANGSNDDAADLSVMGVFVLK